MTKIFFLTLILCLPFVYSAPVFFNQGVGANFHGYELISGSTWTWTQARDAAAARTIVVDGVTYTGHLVTITSAAENEFIRTNFSCTMNPWIGAYQYDKAVEPAGHWRWVTDEVWSYTNWNSGEPNNSGGAEEYAQFYNTGFWNDLANNGLSGYIVEYDVVAPEPNTLGLLLVVFTGIWLRLKTKKN